MRPREERKVPFPELSMHADRRDEQQFPFDWHRHEAVELAYIIEGYGTRYVGSSIEPYSAGDLILLGSGVPHSWQSDGECRINRAIYFQIAPQVFTQLEALPDFFSLTELLKKADGGISLQVNDPGAVEAALSSILILPRGVRIIRIIEFLLNMAESADIRKLSEIAGHSYQESGYRIDTVLSYIQSHYADVILRSQLADLVSLAPASFSRFFYASTGTSWSSYLMKFRIHQACRLLQNSEQQVLEIALDTGFHSLSLFNRKFRELTGLTPTGYRRRIKEGA
jgi:AraC-like DNA-binding protein